MAKLAEQFVCVRIQSMNGQNIGLFQFEYDLTFMAFFMDDNDRFYARYGGREDDHAESHLSKESILRTMRVVLELHKENKVQTSRYEPKESLARTPEDVPGLTKMLERRKPGNRCIHCHDVKVADLVDRRERGAFRKELIYSNPTPLRLGLLLDRDDQQLITEVKPGSIGSRAGLQKGDRIANVDGQRILTLGDFARVLELSPNEATLPIDYQRGGQTLKTKLQLSGNWRESPDPSWRSSTHWAGPNAGFWAMPLTPEEKKSLGIPVYGLALRINFFFNNHPTPGKAGLQMKDVVIELDGMRKEMTPRQLHAHLQMRHEFGDKVSMTIRRGDKEIQVTLELPDKPPPLE